jgi:hypothetical protein
MKKLITSAFLVASFLTVNAGSENKDYTAQATVFARQMISQVQLNESEYIAVRKLTIEKLQLVAQVESMYSNDPEMMNKKLSEIESNYNFNLKHALSAKQYENFVAAVNAPKQENSAVAADISEQ